MTHLDRRAMLTMPMPKNEVQELFNGKICPWPQNRIQPLCASHERLRMEAEGAAIMWHDEEDRVKELEAENLRLRAEIVELREEIRRDNEALNL